MQTLLTTCTSFIDVRAPPPHCRDGHAPPEGRECSGCIAGTTELSDCMRTPISAARGVAISALPRMDSYTVRGE